MSRLPTPAGTQNQAPPTSEWRAFGRDARRDMIDLLESRTETTLLCYVSLNELISREDIVYMRELLQPLPPGISIDLLLNSPGGDVDTAEKLVQMALQTITPHRPAAKFRLIVPDRAKSTATLIALGADSVVMGDTSELGPIDPQVILPDQRGVRLWHSVCDYLEAYKDATENYRTNPQDPVFRIMLEKFDPVLLRSLERSNDRYVGVPRIYSSCTAEISRSRPVG